jgi:hypothetical protein
LMLPYIYIYIYIYIHACNVAWLLSMEPMNIPSKYSPARLIKSSSQGFFNIYHLFLNRPLHINNP